MGHLAQHDLLRMIANLLWFKAMWLSCVLANNLALLWVVPMLGLHLHLCRERRRELTLIGCCVVIGLGVEWGFLRSGVLQPGMLTRTAPLLSYSGPPVWMLLLWAAFATTLGHSLRWFQHHMWWAAAVGAVGGVLSYLGGSQLTDVALGEPLSAALLSIALVWSAVMPLLAWLSRRLGV